MSQIAIRATGLSKQYRIGTARTSPDSLRELVTKRLRRMFRSEGEAGDDHHTLWALQEASFEVKAGEVVGVIGRNGAGKSTLLKVLSRITDPTAGRAEITGRVGSLLEVGTGFHPDLTGRENVYLNGAVLGIRKAEISRRFDEIVSFAEIERFIDTPVKHYSSGMYVRLAFAVAAHLEPDVLIVDEVLAVGDMAFQSKCLGRMHNVAGQGRTVLFVSHNMESVQALCHRGILLSEGRIVADTSVGDAVKTYVAGFTQAARQSLADRTDRGGDGRIRFTEFWLESSDGLRIGKAIVGQDISFCFEYVATGPLRNFYMQFNLQRTIGDVLVNCNNRDAGYTVDIVHERGVIACSIKRFPVRAGRYIGNVYSEANGVTMDWVQGAFTVDVVDGDFYGTGKLGSQGRVLVLHDWDTRPLARTLR